MKKRKQEPFLHKNSEGKYVSGVGPGVGLALAEEYFTQARQVIRIATAYFSLKGYKSGRKFYPQSVQVRVLVGRRDSVEVQAAVIDEIEEELKSCETDLWETVYEIVERIRVGQFIIRDARRIDTPFHCKFYISDDELLWHGSANYSWNGLSINAEQVSFIHDPAQINGFINWYDQIANDAFDLLKELKERLERWLELAKPFDIYLKALFIFYNLPSYSVRGDAHSPTYFQKGFVISVLSQLESFGGAIGIAATGLGKTVMGTEIAGQLQQQGKIKRVIIIAPGSVRENWRKEFEGRDINFEFFSLEISFREGSDSFHHQVSRLDRKLEEADTNTFILVDEAHRYKNQLKESDDPDSTSLVYERLMPAINRRAKIVLLTATAYSTSLKNLNSLLYLLPWVNKNAFDLTVPWNTRTIDDFTQLPVVTILGLPHVQKMAEARGDIDEAGRPFFEFVNEKRYLPESIKLYPENYTLCMENRLCEVFDRQCFDHTSKMPHLFFDDETFSDQRGLTDSSYNTALTSWLSSPSAMRDSIVKNLEKPGRVGEEKLFMSSLEEISKDGSVTQLGLWSEHDFDNSIRDTEPGSETPMLLPLNKRKRLLTPALESLEEVINRIEADDKLEKLENIIDLNLIMNDSKIIIFVNRYLTALYLEKAIKDTCHQVVSVACTVEESDGSPRLKSSEQRYEVLRNFSPSSHNYVSDNEYNILICTDADGIGVNLQDASIIVNYDPPKGADELFQRAGRVLRITKEPRRIIHIYTLIPSIVNEDSSGSRVKRDVCRVFERIQKRHDKSRRVLGSDVLSLHQLSEITLESEVNVDKLMREENLEWRGPPRTIADHQSVLSKHFNHAELLPDCIFSACYHAHKSPKVFVLLHNTDTTEYYRILFDPTTKEVKPLSIPETLNLLACPEAEERAPIDTKYIEQDANQAAQIWCESEDINIIQVNKICVLYLASNSNRNSFKSFLRREPS